MYEMENISKTMRCPGLFQASHCFLYGFFSRCPQPHPQEEQLPQQPDFFGLRISQTANPAAAATRSRTMMSDRFMGTTPFGDLMDALSNGGIRGTRE